MAEREINVAQQDTLESVASTVNTINTNAARLTAARATKIDNIGATGDTGGSSTAGTLFGKLNKIISDIATFVGNWTATRAGYIDNIKTRELIESIEPNVDYEIDECGWYAKDLVTLEGEDLELFNKLYNMLDDIEDVTEQLIIGEQPLVLINKTNN